MDSQHQSERWDRLQDLFWQASQIDDPAERASFLEGACRGDAALRQDIESLASAEASLVEKLDAPAGYLLDGPAWEGVDSPLLENSRIGGYQVLRELGHGGMGTVFAARGDEGQEVAVKVLRAGLDSAEVAYRFRTERWILGRLQHPNIAALLDAGTTEQGLPFFVMEAVEGCPIDRYCDAHRLDVPSRLVLFSQVLSAVHFAHQNLIVHRDLKPSNILIDRDGVPKLLDFGIAKLLDPESREPVTVTTLGSRPMTPQYASPEQVRSEPITTASDIYGLGLLLYELLTGQRPYQFTSRDEAEVRRLVCEAEPRRPSAMVPPGAHGQTVAEARRSDPRRLARQLRGDLDNIVMTALEKDPSRRYASAEQLREDLQRHLDGEPVLARPHTPLYRLGKFCRRNARQLVIAAILFGVFTAFVGDRIRQQERIARERDRAQQLSTFMVELFALANPHAARGETVTAREVLDRAAERVEGELEDQPGLQAAVMRSMAEAYRGLGLFETSRTLVQGAFERRIRPDVGEDKAATEDLVLLAELDLALGDFEQAGDRVRQAMLRTERLWGRKSVEFADLQGLLAVVLQRQGHLDDAGPLLRQALADRIELLGDEDVKIAAALNDLGTFLVTVGNYEEAEQVLTRSLAIFQAQDAEDLQDLSTVHNNLAMVLMRRGALDLAEPHMRESYNIRRSILEDGHPNLGQSMNNLGGLLWTRGDSAEAEPLFRAASGIYNQQLGEDHPSSARVLSNLGSALVDLGRSEEAIQLFDRALKIQRLRLGEDHVHVANTEVNLGLALLEQNRPQEALVEVQNAWERLQRQLPVDHWRSARAESIYGSCLAALGRRDEAEAHLRQALERLSTIQGAGLSRHPREARQRLEALVGTAELAARPVG